MIKITDKLLDTTETMQVGPELINHSEYQPVQAANTTTIKKIAAIEVDVHKSSVRCNPKPLDSDDCKPSEAIDSLAINRMYVEESFNLCQNTQGIVDMHLNDSSFHQTLSSTNVSDTAPCEIIELVDIEDTELSMQTVSEKTTDDFDVDYHAMVSYNAWTGNVVVPINMHDTLKSMKMATVDSQTVSRNTCINLLNSGELTIGHKYITNVHGQKIVRELPIGKYIWKATLKNSTKMEKISCSAVSFSVLFCISVVIFYFLYVKKQGMQDADQEEWYIPRNGWLAESFNSTVDLAYKPAKLVVIQHSVSRECHNYVECSVAVHTIQSSYIHIHQSDIPYNFLVGYDGRIYEGRGWGIESVCTRWLNICLMSIGYIGDYRHARPTDQQLNRTKMLLAEGVSQGHLDPNYSIVGASDILLSDSPGIYLYEAIQQLEHYEFNSTYNHKTCAQIHAPEGTLYIDKAPHEWLISRDDWLADTYDSFNKTPELKPLKLVIIDDYITRDCYIFYICRSQLINLQAYFWRLDTEISYNFMVGNDGRLYETRGWGIEAGDEILQFQPCALFIAFFGNYTDYKSLTQATVSQAQVNRTHMLLDEGVRKGYLHQDYIVVGANDILEDRHLGKYLYEEINTWQHYDSLGLKKDITCSVLDSLFDLI